MIARRSFLRVSATALVAIAAPAIVRAASLDALPRRRHEGGDLVGRPKPIAYGEVRNLGDFAVRPWRL